MIPDIRIAAATKAAIGEVRTRQGTQQGTQQGGAPSMLELGGRVIASVGETIKEL